MNRYAIALLLFFLAGCSGGATVSQTDQAKAETLFKHAQAQIQAGDTMGAFTELSEAIALNPEHYEALAARGAIYHQRREYQQAIDDLKKAVAPETAKAAPLSELAWILATCPDDTLRNGEQAVRYARIAVLRGGTNWKHLDTLAAALAESGDFTQAVTFQTALLQHPPEEEGVAAELQQRLAAYQASRPWREE